MSRTGIGTAQYRYCLQGPEPVLCLTRTGNVHCSEPVLIVQVQNRFWAVLRTGIVRSCAAPNRKCSEPVLGSVPEPVLGVHRTGIGPLPVSGMPLLLNTAIELPRTGIVQLPLWGVTCLVLNTGFGAQNRFCAVLCSKPVLSSPEPVLDHYRYWE